MKKSVVAAQPRDARFKPITLDEFASYWGMKLQDVPPEFTPYFTRVNTLHRSAEKDDLEKYIAYFISKVNKSTARRTTEENISIFQQGWATHKHGWQEKGDITALVPLYFQNAKPYFLGPDGKVAVADEPLLLMHMQELTTRFLSLVYFKEYREIHEFGSCSGWNLMLIGTTTPDKKITGYEWTPAGVELATMIGQKSGLNISGHHFDMLEPDYSIQCQGDAVFTFCAIEQLQEKYDKFIDFILEKKPGIVVNLEPDGCDTSEVSMHDLLSDFYLKLRGYSRTLLKKLESLHQQKQIEILLSQRLPWLTSFHHLRCTVWKPV